MCGCLCKHNEIAFSLSKIYLTADLTGVCAAAQLILFWLNFCCWINHSAIISEQHCLYKTLLTLANVLASSEMSSMPWISSASEISHTLDKMSAFTTLQTQTV